MNDDIAIRVEGLWKRYGLSIEPALRRALRSLISFGRPDPRRSESDDGPWALREVSFEVRRGETLGIIGRNGAGKSTLLKVLAGVTLPTRGRVEVRGEVFPMIELNAGVHPELTGRENVYLLGAIMGLSQSKVEDVLPEIEEFIELGEWFDRPVRMYSSGMLARLGFGVATSIRSDILLIDETFSVGDLKFQNKSLARVKQMRESGATILLVTHNLDMLQFVSQRGLVLDGGLIVAEGSALEGLSAYEKLVFRSEQARLQHRVRQRISSDALAISHAHVYGSDGTPVTEVAVGNSFGLEVSFRLRRPVDRPVWSIGILNAVGVVCTWNVSEEDGFACQRIEGGYRLRLWYQENRLATGVYKFNFALRDGNSFETLERITGMASFSIVGPGRARGIVMMSPQWELGRDQSDCEPSAWNGHEARCIFGNNDHE